MADNTDSLPLFIPVPPANHLHDKVIVGDGNRVATATKNIIVNGSDNTISEYCENINLLNCSGVYVYPNVSGATALNSSGIVISANNEVYINNELIDTNTNLSTLRPYQVITDNYTATLGDEIMVFGVSGKTITISDYNTLGGAKVYQIKNKSGGDCYIVENTDSGVDEDGINTITIADGESYTLCTSIKTGATFTAIL